MTYKYDEAYSFAEWAFDLEKHIPKPFQTTLTSSSPPPSPSEPASAMMMANSRFEPPPRWDSFRNRIMTDEQAAEKAREDAARAAERCIENRARKRERWDPAKLVPKDLSVDLKYVTDLGRRCRISVMKYGARQEADQGWKMKDNKQVREKEREEEEGEDIGLPSLKHAVIDYCVRQAGPVLDLIIPHKTDNILDIGCGDGALTAALALRVRQGTVVGLDSSAKLIEDASTTYTSEIGNLTFVKHDCSRLDQKPEELLKWEGAWDWVFSNSTFHWILRDADDRQCLFPNIYRLLKPGGRLVFEFGGAGHVPDAITAFTAAMAMHGIPSEKRRDANPWFFPSADWTREALEGAGFEVEECAIHYRPAKVSMYDGSLQAWVKQLGSKFLDAITPEEGEKREEVVKWVCNVLNDSLERKEDGTRWLTYTRLRVLAKKGWSTDSTTSALYVA